MAAGGAPTNMQKEQMFGLAEKEMEYRVDLFNRLTQTCFEKCIEKRHKDAELNMGENSCIDRFLYVLISDEEVIKDYQ
nr:unnamed protein product [Digitaria exilis]